MTEVGKAAKKMGRERAAVLKRLEPVPSRATPRKVAKREIKPFGFSYEFQFVRGWKRYFEWFKTDTARTQALSAFTRKHANSIWVRGIQPENKS